MLVQRPFFLNSAPESMFQMYVMGLSISLPVISVTRLRGAAVQRKEVSDICTVFCVTYNPLRVRQAQAASNTLAAELLFSQKVWSM